MLALFTLNNANAQGAKVTITGESAVVTVDMSVEKALKTAINAGIQSRADCELFVEDPQEDFAVLFISEYKNGTYYLSVNEDSEITDTYSSTRVADIRLKIAELLGMSTK